MIPVLILMTLGIMSLTIHMAKHGEQKTEPKYNYWLALFLGIITWGLYYWAGLFNVFLN